MDSARHFSKSITEVEGCVCLQLANLLDLASRFAHRNRPQRVGVSLVSLKLSEYSAGVDLVEHDSECHGEDQDASVFRGDGLCHEGEAMSNRGSSSGDHVGLISATSGFVLEQALEKLSEASERVTTVVVVEVSELHVFAQWDVVRLGSLWDGEVARVDDARAGDGGEG